uniref:Dynein light chain n=1 Tax=Heterorhabditis bacteriophora TaxID=37862 RepID=A0A1I7XI07_HETBA
MHKDLYKFLIEMMKEEDWEFERKAAKALIEKVQEINCNHSQMTQTHGWFCVFGKQFSAAIPINCGSLLHCYVDQYAIVLYRCTNE